MTKFALDTLISDFPAALEEKRVGVVCHAASVTSDYVHIVDFLSQSNKCILAAIFGPQHGLYGQTQDNMIEWEGAVHPKLKIPVYSLYGKVRKPTKEMLNGLDALIFDVQDVGARPYTYIWTLKWCMEACADQGIPLWVLDRPNPIGALSADGPVMSEEFYSFVGGAPIPLCHRLTMGEMALILQKLYYQEVDLNIRWMEGWWRNSLWSQTGLPWVLPSPNMPTVDTAIVYPGQVLLEATNISEGRGTTRPFELFGAPFIRHDQLRRHLQGNQIKGCILREHDFIPSFQKWSGKYCRGFQIHVTDPHRFNSVEVSVAIIGALIREYPEEFEWKQPPYEYEYEKLPFDILIGNSNVREALMQGVSAAELRAQWLSEYGPFEELIGTVAHYREQP
ncbi:Uncharacterized protein CHISP_1370 [Chitinispirillum alkaliphilum]|nr:Uncharacterized protein CHISP_1370 [Chitinispirillum alkaliphilum]